MTSLRSLIVGLVVFLSAAAAPVSRAADPSAVAATAATATLAGTTDANVGKPRCQPGDRPETDDLVSDRFGDRLRLEQERIDWAWAEPRFPLS